MNNLLRDISQLILTPVAVIGAVTYLIRRYLDMSFAKNLEGYKIELKAETDKKLFQFQTQFSRLHDRRIDIIAELYKLLSISSRHILDLTSPLQMGGGPPLVEKKTITADAFNDLSMYFDEHRIYFAEQTCTQMDAVLKLIKDAFIDFDTAHQIGMQGSQSYKPDDTGLWVDSWKTVTEQLPPVIAQVEKEFRELLYVK